MKSENNFTWPQFWPIANKPFEHFGDRRRCNRRSERYDCRLDSGERWRIPFILQTAVFIGSHKLRRCAL
jgi:hypothetical protein